MGPHWEPKTDEHAQHHGMTCLKYLGRVFLPEKTLRDVHRPLKAGKSRQNMEIRRYKVIFRLICYCFQQRLRQIRGNCGPAGVDERGPRPKNAKFDGKIARTCPSIPPSGVGSMGAAPYYHGQGSSMLHVGAIPCVGCWRSP